MLRIYGMRHLAGVTVSLKDLISQSKVMHMGEAELTSAAAFSATSLYRFVGVVPEHLGRSILIPKFALAVKR